MTGQVPALREPKQERSRVRFERVQDAAVALLVERGPDAFTLAEVCTRADASVSAIYNRVKSKDDLIRIVHEREMGRIDRDTKQILQRSDLRNGKLGDAVARLINDMTEVLRRNAAVMRPFMLLAVTDKQISIRGKQSHRMMIDQFIALLSQRREEIRHPEPTLAIEWCFTIVYSVIGRQLGFHSSMESALDDDWDMLKTNLTDTVTAYLSFYPQIPAG
jgi:AcrR family transcriptional regulator